MSMQAVSEFYDECMKWCPYESMLWPLSMMLYPFASPFKIIRNIIASRSNSNQRESKVILILAGTEDVLMDTENMKNLARWYRKASSQISGQVEDKVMQLDENGDSEGDGVRQVWIGRAGHHVQNDVHWEIGARKLTDWYEQL
jgi:hypothetical protein